MSRKFRQKTSIAVLFVMVIAVLAISASVAWAETVYVSDKLVVGIRQNMAEDSEVIKYVETDEPLEVLEKNGDSLRVRTREGDEGWIRERYLTSSTPKPVIITGLERKISALEESLSKKDTGTRDVREKLRAAEEDSKECRRESSAMSEELKDMNEKYNNLLENSENVTELVAERNSLRAANDMLNADKERLTAENTGLKRRQMMYWFAAGGGVFLIGWLAGKFSRKKRIY